MTDWQTCCQTWLKSPLLEEEERRQIQRMTEEERQTFFSAPLAFGTAGLRGETAPGPGGVNRFTIAQAALAFGQFLLETQPEARQKGVCLCGDARRNSREFVQIAAEALSSLGLLVFLFPEPRPTPELSFAVRRLGAAGGMNITASHNPRQFNGCKLYRHTGAQLTDEECAQVAQKMAVLPLLRPLPQGDAAQIRPLNQTTDQDYLDAVAQECCPEEQTLPWRGRLTIVYTPLHGVGGLLLPQLLRSQGFTNLHCVEAQMAPAGNFPTAPAPNPVQTPALEPALELARQVRADLVVATDPDADRVAFAALRQGEYQILSGHQAGCLLAEHLFSARCRTESLPENPFLVKSLVTTQLAEQVARFYGGQTLDTFTGFKHMANLAQDWEDKGRGQCILAFEEAIGAMVGGHCRDKDGLAAALALCHLAAQCLSQGLSLWDKLEQLYQTHGFYLEDAFSLTFQGPEAQAHMAAAMDRLRTQPPASLGGLPLLEIQDYLPGIALDIAANCTKPLCLSGANMVYYKAAGGDLAVRPSGTEPKIKCYLLAQGQSRSQAEERLSALRQAAPALLDQRTPKEKWI